jgi:thioredoxin 1
MSEEKKILEVDDNNFKDEVLESEQPVLVDFWAPWCMPCRMLAPTLEQIALEYNGKIKVCKVNVDNSPQTASSYGIMSIPTIVLFKAGEVADKTTGVVTAETLKAKINENI